MQGIIISVHAFILTDYVVFQFPAPLGLYIHIYIYIHMSCQTWIDNPGSCWVPSCSTRCTGTRWWESHALEGFSRAGFQQSWGVKWAMSQITSKRRLKTLRLGYTGKCGGSDSSTIAIVNYTILFKLALVYIYIYDTPFFKQIVHDMWQFLQLKCWIHHLDL